MKIPRPQIGPVYLLPQNLSRYPLSQFFQHVIKKDLKAELIMIDHLLGSAWE